MKKIFLIAMCFSFSFLWGAELVIAQKGKKSPYAIVYTHSCYRKAAEFLRSQIKEATGVELPIISKVPKTPAIVVTNLPGKLIRWKYRIDSAGNKIYLRSRDENSIVSGSLRAAIAFLEETTGFAAFAPGDKGFATPPQEKILFDSAKVIENTPRLKFNVTVPMRWNGLVYEIANNLFPAPWYAVSGGHSHWRAMPESLRKTHPHLFALSKGKRVLGTGRSWNSSYCYAQIEVHERIFQDIRRYLNGRHTFLAEVGHNDIFIHCECEKCKKIKRSEQLWTMHRDLALRWQKSNPGKMVNIMAYSVAQDPPESFKEFPANVMVNLAPFNEKALEKWSKVKVPGGFSAYLYNWEYYQLEGFMPKLGSNALRKQTKLLRDHNVAGLYRCGFGELFGLEGWAYYLWGKLLEDPEADTAQLMKRYCRAAFGKAAPYMEKMYTILDRTLNGYDVDRSTDWYKVELLADKTPALIETARLHVNRYPRKVTAAMESELAKAEKAAPENRLIKLARIEFDYLKLTVETSLIFDEMRKSHSQKDWLRLLDALEKRQNFIAKLPVESVRGTKQIAKFGEFRLMGCAPVSTLMQGGRLRGRLRAPFNWESSLWRKRDFKPFGRTIANDGKAHLLVQRNFSEPDKRIEADPTYVSVTGTRNKLQIIFTAPKAAPDTLNKGEFYLFFGDSKNRYRLAGRPFRKFASFYRRTQSVSENGGQGDVYTLVPTEKFPMIMKNGKVVVTVDLDKMGVSGNTIDFNANRFGPAAWIFEYNLDQKTYRQANDKCGKLTIK